MTDPAAEIVIGSTDFTEQPLQRSIRIGEPITTTHTYHGPQYKSDDFMAYLLQNYNVLTLEQQKGVPSIIQITTDETPDGSDPDLRVLAEVVWSLDWEREMKDLHTHGWFDDTDDMTQSSVIMEAIDLALRKKNAAATDWDAQYSTTHMNDYRNAKIRGIDHYVNYAPSLRATLRMGRYTQLDVKAVPVSKVITWADIALPFPAATAQTPDTGGIIQPIIHCYIGSHPPTGATGHAWQDLAINQWMLSPVRRSFNKTRGIYEMTFEWLGAVEWTSFLYDGGSGLLD